MSRDLNEDPRRRIGTPSGTLDKIGEDRLIVSRLATLAERGY